MSLPRGKWMSAFSAALIVATVVAIAAVPLRAEELEKSKKVGGVKVDYKVILPNGYDPAKAYPAILAFGGGPQTMNTVDRVLIRTFGPRPRSAATS